MIKTAAVLFLCASLGACATVQPYGEVALTYALPFSSDYWVNSEQSWQCEQPEFDAEVGVEFRNGIRVGLHHYSMLLCGSWNNKAEVYNNGIRVSKSWGGW